MATAVHIPTMRRMLDTGKPVDLLLWKRNGEICELRNCVSLRYDFRHGTRNVKLLDSRQIRKVRDVCIFEINGLQVYL